MTAISMWQPWATLFLLRDPDEKRFETRKRYTHYRGDILVHAAKKRDGDVRAALADPHFQERLAVHGLTVDDLAFGALIGQTRIEGCCQMRHMPEPCERERLAGNWAPERYAWERGRVTRIFAQAIPFVGRQGFFEVPVSAIEGAL